VKLILGFSFAVATFCLVGCHGGESTTSPTSSKPQLTSLLKEDVKVGSGETAAVGDKAFVEYTGTLPNGVVFDSNMTDGKNPPDKPPFSFILKNGPTTVIEGWNQGIVGMKVGGERKLSIPWKLAYGEAGQPKAGIDSETDLFFDVKLDGIVKSGQETVIKDKEVKTGSGPDAKSGDWVTVSYVIKLANGKEVDNSNEHSPALQFQAGTGNVGDELIVPIAGLVAGVVGMKAGGERLLYCPPVSDQGMSKTPGSKIPTDTMLVIDLKLLRVSPKKLPDMEEPKS
jgi:FKBP-type peptidyl-prolyl cis-trans isomerase